MNKDIEAIFQGMRIGDEPSEDALTSDEFTTLTLWIERDYKARFRKLQRKTKKDFGRRIREFIYQSIDMLDTEKDAG